MSDAVPQDLMSDAVAQDLMSDAVAQDLLSDAVAQDLLSDAVAQDLLCRLLPVKASVAIPLPSCCVAIALSTLGRQRLQISRLGATHCNTGSTFRILPVEYMRIYGFYRWILPVEYRVKPLSTYGGYMISG